MTVSSERKRLDAVEVALTPKEWAIRLADQKRLHPSAADFMRALSKTNFQDLPNIRPYLALIEQAEGRNPGKKPEDSRARFKLTQALRLEFHGLKLLIGMVNDDIEKKGEIFGIKAALKLAKLETIVLQDAFGRTTRMATHLIQAHKNADTEKEEDRQHVIDELNSYFSGDHGEKWTESLPPPDGIRIRFPSVIEDWAAEVIALASHVFAHRAAVQLIQTQHFDGHPILFRNVEATLDNAVKTLEHGIATFNDYLKIRAELSKEEWETDGNASTMPVGQEGYLAIAIDAICAEAQKKETERIAAEWIGVIRERATVEIQEETDADALVHAWNRLRGEIAAAQ
jgi:hypothetical protein